MFRRRRGTGRATGERAGPVTAQGPVSDALTLEGVGREYRRGVVALHPVDLAVPRGRFLAVMGPSGSGKSTLLQCAAGLDRPTAGTVRIGGTEVSSLSEAALTRLRRERVGFVFQAHALVPSLSVAENVALPLLLGGTAGTEGTERVRQGLADVGLGERGDAAPSELSGGQCQRVAVARALVTGPDIVFADEPTGSLDPAAARDVLALLRRAVDRDGHTVVMVTHDPVAAAWTDEALFLAGGRVVGRETRPDAAQVGRIMRSLGRVEGVECDGGHQRRGRDGGRAA
ncbi:ABC transporter ATP-binding protein [Streptomyces tubercidicus]|uniref:ABC transporter ATP-binding protein n=1 Tax=Streptomyces tubercidicus TaxID=47759 RepID=A0A640UUE6_9ACTN|nr:ABC transporter ATP-binding protein [Streptomyces tubercidicus]WAU16588.1 ABC transporter ATP-binding protein [Streptomyces tubercidicus]GFE38341.1 ABC transporter ATP-binding protein [Streptomyces tubercidicus]